MKTELENHIIEGLDEPSIEKRNAIKIISSFHIFLKWDNILQSISNFEAGNNRVPTDDEIKILINRFKIDRDDLQAFLVQTFETINGTENKKHFITTNQRLVVRLLNKLDLLSHTANAGTYQQAFYNTITQELEHLLLFIEELFLEFINKEELIPPHLLGKKKSKLRSVGEKTSTSIINEEGTNTDLLQLIFANIEYFLSDKNKNIQYKDLTYHEVLLEALSHLEIPPSNKQLQVILYSLNYNHEAFIEFEIERLLKVVMDAENDKHKISLLRWEQKLINQYPVKLHLCYDDSMPSLRDQLNRWVNEEAEYLESGHLFPAVGPSTQDSTEKIHTSFSVAKLAVVIRLLVIDKIIINRTIAPMLRVVAKTFTTLQRDEISFGSLETKYHAPDKATVMAVKDMLFKWINILSKLEKQF